MLTAQYQCCKVTLINFPSCSICCNDYFAGKSWLEEFKRLCYHIPVVQTETLTDHMNQVLHVSFSHNGKYFATCSKDGYVLVNEKLYFIYFLN